MKRDSLWSAIISFVILSIIVIAVSSYFVFNQTILGPIFLVLGILSLIFIRSYGVHLHAIYPDIVFGVIDNGVLIFAAVIGGTYAGIGGAVIGGAAGNTITDGLGGLFEGRLARDLRKNHINSERTALSSMIGKMIGCLLGAGIGLILVFFIGLI